MKEDDEYYSKEQFEICGFNNDKKQSYDENVVSRMRNCFVGAIRDQKTLPKYAVIVLDADIIKLCTARDIHSTEGFWRISKWLMCQFDRLVETQKEYLLLKAKRNSYPTFVWIQPPTHIHLSHNQNRLRLSFGCTVEKEAAYHENTYALQLKKVWDCNDSTLFDKEDRHFTAKGHTNYWIAVDRAIKFADTLLLKKKMKKEGRGDKVQDAKPNDRFHWNRYHRGYKC